MDIICVFFFFKQKTAYEMRISDWSSDVCSSDLQVAARRLGFHRRIPAPAVGPRRDADRARMLRRVVGLAEPEQIGSASCRERVCQYVSISVVAVSLTNNKHTYK